MVSKTPTVYPWEVKLVLMLATYCFFKFFHSNSFVLAAARIIFIVGHGFLYWKIARFNVSVMKRPGWTIDSKEKARSQIQQDLLRPLFIRGIIVAIVHLKFSVNPPLFVSLIMGYLSLLEATEAIEQRHGD